MSLPRASSRPRPSQTMKNTAILTLTEYKSIKQRMSVGGQSEEQQIRHVEKIEMKERSDNRVKNWPNTIQGLRKRKDDSKFERFEKDEEERRKIDLEEAAIKMAAKQEILGKANRQIYENNDRVKAFQSALLMSDTLKDREAQILIAQRKKEINQTIDENWQKVEKENMKAYDEREEEKRKIEIEKTRINQQILKGQHNEAKMRYFKRLQEQVIEGELIKFKAQEAIEKQKAEERARKEKLLEAHEETRKGNEILKELKRQEKLKELEQEKEIEEFAKKKEAIVGMRRYREELRFKEKQAARQKIIDAQVEALRKMKNREDEILNKHIKEAEIKAEENERIKQEKKEQLVQEIDKQIAITLAKRQEEKTKQKTEEKNFQEFWQKKNQELEDREVADKNAYKERCVRLQDYHRKQSVQKQRKLEEEIAKEFDDALRMQAAIQDEEKTFNSYAEMCIKQWDDKGKNVKPLLLQLEKLKKASKQ